MRASASFLPLRSGGRCRRRKGALFGEAESQQVHDYTVLPPSAPAGAPSPAERGKKNKTGTSTQICLACLARPMRSQARLSFPCAAGEGAEGGRGRFLATRKANKYTPTPCCPLPPLPGHLPPRSGGRKIRPVRRVKSARLVWQGPCARKRAFPSPAQRGKVPKAEGGAFWRRGKPTSTRLRRAAPFRPCRGTFPRGAGEGMM